MVMQHPIHGGAWVYWASIFCFAGKSGLIQAGNADGAAFIHRFFRTCSASGREERKREPGWTARRKPQMGLTAQLLPIRDWKDWQRRRPPKGRAFRAQRQTLNRFSELCAHRSAALLCPSRARCAHNALPWSTRSLRYSEHGLQRKQAQAPLSAS